MREAKWSIEKCESEGSANDTPTPSRAAQMKDREERDRSWANFRREMESGNRRKLARYIGRR